MNRTDATQPPAPLIALGDQDAAVCADGVCDVPAPQVPEPTATRP
jgi:hypothetical protein